MDINQAPIDQEFYTYAINFSSLANGTSATDIINIENEAYFKVQKLTYVADLALAAQTSSTTIVPLVTIVITDTGSGRQLSNTPISIPALFGTAELPFILPTPKVYKPRSSISITVANYSAATTYNLRINLHGAKIWY